MKQVLTIVIAAALILAAIAGLWYGGWRLERWWHYKFGYESSVKADIEKETRPIKLEIEALRKRVETLEAKGK